jgi:DnaJ homolog subfamily C member 19
MLIIIASLLAIVAFAYLVRRLWLTRANDSFPTLFAVATAALVVALALLAATGRLHWIAAVVAGLLPFARRLLGLLRYAPLVGRLYTRYRNGAGGSGRNRAPGPMSRDEALQILGLGPSAGRDEIIAAHRRLIQKLHPDRGGSKFLAQQLNEAKRRLLDER